MKKIIEGILNKKSKFILDMDDFNDLEKIILHKQIKVVKDEKIIILAQKFRTNEITSIILNIDYKEDVSLETFSKIVEEVRESIKNQVDVIVGTTISEDTTEITVDIFYRAEDVKYKDISVN